MTEITGAQVLEEVKKLEERLSKNVTDKITELKGTFKEEVVAEVKKLIPATQPTFQAGADAVRLALPEFKGFTKPEAEALRAQVCATLGIDAATRRRKQFSTDELKNMGVTIGADGGYGVPDQFLPEVLRKLVKASVFMGPMGARVFSGVGLNGSMNKETGTVTFIWENEAVDTAETGKAALGKIVWSLKKLKGLTDMSMELLKFSAVDFLNLLSTMYGEQQAVVLDAVFMNGSGQNRPLGLRKYLTGVNTIGQNAANLAFTDLLALKHKLPVQYRAGAVWLMPNEIIELIGGIVDGDDRPIFLEVGTVGAAALAGKDVPDQTIGFLLGKPVLEQNDIPQNLGGGADSEIWFTNLQRAYGIFNSGAMEMSSDDSQKFSSDITVVKGVQFVDGKPTITEASAYLSGVK